jgi:hypothetical protein
MTGSLHTSIGTPTVEMQPLPRKQRTVWKDRGRMSCKTISHKVLRYIAGGVKSPVSAKRRADRFVVGSFGGLS